MNKFYIKSAMSILIAATLAVSLHAGALLNMPVSPLQAVKQLPSASVLKSSDVADWSVVTYIQADNNLAPYAVFNVREMQKANIPLSLNVLVEWDKPGDNMTWRYQVKKNSLTDVGSFLGAHDLGFNPVQEIIDMAVWAKANYNARQWCFVLWNHEYGVIDPYLQRLNKDFGSPIKNFNTVPRYPWLALPGMAYPYEKERGILFDDTQGTYVTNTQLTTMFQGVSAAIGGQVDIVGMDACLMAMIEVGYQLTGYVKYLVSSQNTEPGNGWDYAGLLRGLSANAALMTPQQFAALIVQRYGMFYYGRDNSVTLSTISIDALVPLKDNVNLLVQAIAACRALNPSRTKAAVMSARSASIQFEITDYVDMYSFYDALLLSLTKSIRNQRPLIVQGKPKLSAALARAEAAFVAAVRNAKVVLNNGKALISSAVLSNSVGSAFSNAKGLSIYFPLGAPHWSYADTAFARDTSWDQFIAIY